MFPGEIVDRALSHLKRKSLARCRLVCRQWFELADVILDRYRTKKYFLVTTVQAPKEDRPTLRVCRTLLTMNLGEAEGAFMRYALGLVGNYAFIQSHIRVAHLSYLPENKHLFISEIKNIVFTLSDDTAKLADAVEYFSRHPGQLTERLHDIHAPRICNYYYGVLIFKDSQIIRTLDIIGPYAVHVLPHRSWRPAGLFV
jgi:hypothetical protein